MAHEVRETLIARHYDCLAVPLPESVSHPVEAAIEDLPAISVVVLREDQEDSERGAKQASYVPVDPCQAVIMGLRVAMGEGIERAYIDRDVRMYEPDPIHVPDPYNLKTVSVAAYATVLFVLGMINRFADIADAKFDEVGLSLDEERLPKRIRSKSPISQHKPQGTVRK